MRILLSNDDGISAPGIYSLAKMFCDDNDVIICAPDSERSACSHSLSVHSPLRIKKYDMGLPVEAYCCNGTPADCVLFALAELLDEKPDLIISGINTGGNIGQDVFYSGTVSAAFEGASHNIKSVAVSLVMPNKIKDYDPSAKFVYDFLNKYGIDILEEGTVLNINVPPKQTFDEYKLCKLGMHPYNLGYEKRQDTWGKDYYWIKAIEPSDRNTSAGTDVYYIQKGFVTLTPLRYNLTDEKLLNKLKESVK